MSHARQSSLPPWKVVMITDGETDWYGDDYAVEGQIWAALGVAISAHGCTTQQEVLEAVRGADAAVSISVRAPFSARVIEGLDRCRCIVRAGVGYNNIDLEAATRRGIIVSNVPDYCTADVADHTIALILSLVRRLVPLDRFVRGGGWQYSVQLTGPVPRLDTLTLGLVGLGRVARLVARKLGPWVKRVCSCDPYVEPREASQLGIEMLSLNALLETSDIISLHLPLLSETRHLIGKAELARLKSSALLVNTSRGALVDELALARALRDGRLAAAGLDVLAHEPLELDHPLAHLENVVFTPHFAGYSESAKIDLRQSVARAVEQVLRGAFPPHVLNPLVQPRSFSTEFPL